MKNFTIDKKLILYILLGMLGFSLWNTWQKDYPDASASNVDSNFNSTSNSIPNTSSASIISSTARELEIPKSRLITVRTDVLDIAIDTVGGNVVSANLIKFPNVLNSDEPSTLLSNDSAKYYVAQSGLIGSINNTGPDSTDKQAVYTSEKTEYILQPNNNNLTVKLNWSNPNGLAVTKVFTFAKEKYDVKVDYEILNKTKDLWSGKFYSQIERKDFGGKKGMFGINTYTGASISSKKTPYEKISFSDIDSYAKDNKGFIRDSKGGWVAMQQRYFLSTWIPSQDKMYRYFASSRDGIYTIGLSDDSLSIPAGQQAVVGASLYIGPELVENITGLADGLDRTIDYGWEWLWTIAIGLFWCLKKINLVIGNWGWSIILLTLLIKLAFYKLSETSCRSMARMRELMPKIQALKERYGDDKQKLQQATMDLYKQENINPLNMGGCLPMLVQIPFFIALYYVLMNAVELRHSPFIFWIKDLSSHDPYFILPILMGLSMLLQQRLNPTSQDPAQAKVMMFMPIIFTTLFLWSPSGLVLYWFVSNTLSILQQLYINKKLASCS